MDRREHDAPGSLPRIMGKNRQGKWEIRWSERTPDGGWITRRVSTRTDDRAEADAFLVGFLREHAEALARAAASTVSGLIAAYMKDRGTRVGPTQALSLRVVERHLGHHTPAALDRRVLDQYRQARGVKDGTLRRDLGALVAVLNHARRHKLVEPQDVPHIDLPPEGPARDVFLDEQAEMHFWQDMVGAPLTKELTTPLPRTARFAAIALDTAARKEAIETLTWGRVDLSARLIDFRDPTRRVTKKRRVPVPIADRLLPVLERAYRERQDDYVVGKGSIRKAWDTALGRFSPRWDHVTPHVLRHTWATLAARRGVDLFSIAGVLGDTVETVTKHYAHHAPGHLVHAMRRTPMAPPVPPPAPPPPPPPVPTPAARPAYSFTLTPDAVTYALPASWLGADTKKPAGG